MCVLYTFTFVEVQQPFVYIFQLWRKDEKTENESVRLENWDDCGMNEQRNLPVRGNYAVSSLYNLYQALIWSEYLGIQFVF